MKELFKSKYQSIIKWNQKLEDIQGKRIEYIVLFAYMMMLILVSCYHEPWFDEAQAWMIARDASLYDILLVRPHYEGHPALWSLILAIPAKSGVSFEMGIKAVSILFASMTIYLILFRSPFPRLFRIMIPFTYFFFYQYAVISRPYCVMMFVLALMAVCFPTKDIHPFRLAMLLILLCQTSAYGMLFAAGIAIVWLFEMKEEKSFAVYVKFLLHDPQAYALLVLLIAALCEVMQIMPVEATSAMNRYGYENGILVKLIYMFFVIPADAVMYRSLMGEDTIMTVDIGVLMFASAIMVGLVIWGVLFLISRNRYNRLYFIVPYSLFAGFSAAVYFSMHHSGLVALYMMFWLWITESSDIKPGDRSGIKILALEDSQEDTCRLAVKLFVFAALVISVCWSLTSAWQERNHIYGYGRETSRFLKEHELDKLKIMTTWQTETKQEGYSVPENTNATVQSSLLLAYFDDNIIMNHNLGKENMGYGTLRISDSIENESNRSKWKKIGIPDVLLGTVDISKVYGSQVKEEYVPVYKIYDSTIWKGQYDEKWNYLYLRKGLLKSYNLDEIPYEPCFKLKKARKTH